MNSVGHADEVVKVEQHYFIGLQVPFEKFNPFGCGTAYAVVTGSHGDFIHRLCAVEQPRYWRLERLRDGKSWRFPSGLKAAGDIKSFLGIPFDLILQPCGCDPGLNCFSILFGILQGNEGAGVSIKTHVGGEHIKEAFQADENKHQNAEHIGSPTIIDRPPYGRQSLAVGI